MVALIIKISFALIAFAFHVKAGLAVVILLILNEVVDYFFVHNVVRNAVKGDRNAQNR